MEHSHYLLSTLLCIFIEDFWQFSVLDMCRHKDVDYGVFGLVSNDIHAQSLKHAGRDDLYLHLGVAALELIENSRNFNYEVVLVVKLFESE